MNILFDLLIFSLPFGVISRINIYPNAFIYLHDIFASIIFIIFLVRLLAGKIKIENKKLFKYAAIFVGVGLVSLILNSKYLTTQAFVTSFLYVVRYVIYASLLFSVPVELVHFKKYLNVKLVSAGAMFVVFGFIQYFYYPDLRNLYYAGWDEHLYRLFSTLLDPNFAGMFLVLIFLLFFGNALQHREEKNRDKFALFSILSVATLVAVYFTYSRSAFLALIVGVGAMLFVTKRKKVILPALILLIVVLFLFSNSKLEGLNLFRTASSNARIHSVEEAGQIIQRNPILGVGFNAYRYAQQRYGIRAVNGDRITNADAGTDNSYLFVLATTGIVGLAVFMGFIIEVIRQLSRNIVSRDVLSIVALPSFLALLVGTLFLNSIFFPVIMAWMFILIGVTVNKRQ